VTSLSPDNRPTAGNALAERLGCVLLVEDDPEGAAAMLPLIESFGWRVAHAASAEAALELLEAGRLEPDVVLTDISMPGEYDGWEHLAARRRTQNARRRSEWYIHVRESVTVV
jgi:CheY-like chemotaxis protein